ncbi:response regulator [Catenovulum sp. 2E275]|uniref:hybrid sensor histidine kinase/response regulator n=1 Tax=Catenovulum sp. 2E275 TaxID=2980497 RepID=UPI0021CFDB4D|nr:response regulator [Catenovulum sp. 2E275]MCU4676221.1 response regulator [Catenovulum sp. 2E275]
MSAEQDIFRVRRNYNKWVADHTLEDYSLRFTAKSARNWSTGQIAITAIGAISFLALEAIGGVMTLSYGFTNSFLAILTVSLIIFLTALPICYHAAKHGIDIDLLTRGAGFGYIGSTITSLIYASFTFIFFAIEAAIMAMALQLTLNIPLYIGYFVCAVIVIPLVTHGITQISRFQRITQPVWLVLQILPLIFIAIHEWQAFENWTHFELIPVADSQTGYFHLLLFGAAASIMFSLIAQVGEQVDFLRFLPQAENQKKQWFCALIFAGPGWILVGAIKILIGSFLAYLALSHGLNVQQSVDPNHMYLVAFSYISNNPNLVLCLVGLFVVISQLKINVTNAYAGSIAWSNFFSRVTQNHPGRVVWLVFNVAIALLLMELEIFAIMEKTLSIYGLIAVAWVGSLVADLTINKPLKLRPQEIEFKRAHLYDINPVGFGSMILASALGIYLHLGFYGPVWAALASFVTLAATLVLAPLIAWLSKGKFYIARPNLISSTAPAILKCCICEHSFEREDMSFCPAYAGSICSLCCALDTRCHDQCKSNSRFYDQFLNLIKLLLPRNWANRINTRICSFIGLITLACFLIYGLLIFIYFQIVIETQIDQELLTSALVKSSFILIIIAAVICWVFVLMSESRRISMNETRQQTRLLKQEISAHKKTDQELQQAKEIAESANQAKSRYLAGISHELRSPLNAISGYAQLLEKNKIAPERTEQAVSVIRRSSEYLADLIEGLLDISKIEAGKLDLIKNEVHLPSLLNQIVSMFKLQAENKSIEFIYLVKGHLPEFVRTDEKRLRQILINLLSNAIKFTHKGQVKFEVIYKNEIAKFIITDTGVGIDESEHSKIFKPFERIRKPGEPYVSGTGLGLTITNLLTEIMGGHISLNSKKDKGSQFTVSLMLSGISKNYISTSRINQVITSITGDNKLIMLVDDDPTHRGLIKETLSTLGFSIVEAADGFECLNLLEGCQPDLFLLDVSMPGMTGFELTRLLREKSLFTPIIMVSADARENQLQDTTQHAHNDYVVKPVQLDTLIEKIGEHLNLQWNYKTSETLEQFDEKNKPQQQIPVLSENIINELLALSEMGYYKALLSKLKKLQTDNSATPEFISQLLILCNKFQFKQISQILRETL